MGGDDPSVVADKRVGADPQPLARRLASTLKNARRWHELSDEDLDQAAPELERLQAENEAPALTADDANGLLAALQKSLWALDAILASPRAGLSVDPALDPRAELRQCLRGFQAHPATGHLPVFQTPKTIQGGSQ